MSEIFYKNLIKKSFVKMGSKQEKKALILFYLIFPERVFKEDIVLLLKKLSLKSSEIVE